MWTNGKVDLRHGEYYGLTRCDLTLRLAHVLAYRPGPDQHRDSIVAPKIRRDIVGINDTPVLCTYDAPGWGCSERRYITHVRALGRTTSRADRGVSDKGVPGISPHSAGESV